MAAFNQRTANVKNTFYGFKHELNKFANVENLRERFKMTQILAMLLSHLKSFACEKSLDTPVDCVIAYPSYFNTFQQSLILVAAGVAGLNCITMIKETTAVMTTYAFYKKFTDPFNVVFVDFGHSSLQICICKLTTQKIEVLTESSKIIGGRDIDEKIADYFIARLNRPGFSKENTSIYYGLMNEVEKLKKKLTLSSDSFSLDVNLLLRDDTVSLTLNRSEMEKLCEDIFKQVKQLMMQSLIDSGLSLDDINSIEIVGGSSRIPKVKNSVEEVFGKKASITMNQDEAVAKGCMFNFLSSRSNRKLEIVEQQDSLSNKSLEHVEDHENFMRIKHVSLFCSFANSLS